MRRGGGSKVNGKPGRDAGQCRRTEGSRCMRGEGGRDLGERGAVGAGWWFPGSLHRPLRLQAAKEINVVPWGQNSGGKQWGQTVGANSGGKTGRHTNAANELANSGGKRSK
eukprot:366432-Chlamydomonas_euryale.AAC.18